MSEKARGWVDPVMRIGYGARAIVYVIVGGLALYAAVTGGEAQGTTDALADLRGKTWGIAVILISAVGLFAYAFWRMVDAALDLDDYGGGLKGAVARGGLVVTGLIHGAIGVSIAGLALGSSDGGEGGGTQKVVAYIMSMPYGLLLVGLVGLATIGAGGYYAWKGIAERYKRHIRVTPTARSLDPVLKFGCIAMGLVIAVIGVSIVYAATQTDPGSAAGIGEALGQIRLFPFGRFLMAVVALGLIAFAVENAVEAVYRIVPRYTGPDVKTLAHWASRKASMS